MKKYLSMFSKSVAMATLMALVVGSLGFAPIPAYAAGTAKVTIVKYVDGVMATAQNASSSDFQMNANYVISGTPGTGQYALSASGYNGDPTPYQAVTGDLPAGSDYGTNEIIDGTVVGASCSASEQFVLVGYTSGNTLAEAMSAPIATTSPSFIGMTSDKFVIVWNNTCSNGGTIGGTVTGGASNGTLAVTGITAVKTTAIADGTFANGWEYTFNITVPSNETHLSMKFADWMSAVGSTTIAVANNMRISSVQADNANATVLLTAANTYSTPSLNMTGDLNPSLDGKQVQIKIEVAVPSSTVNGVYNTSYGVLAN